MSTKNPVVLIGEVSMLGAEVTKNLSYLMENEHIDIEDYKHIVEGLRELLTAIIDFILNEMPETCRPLRVV